MHQNVKKISNFRKWAIRKLGGYVIEPSFEFGVKQFTCPIVTVGAQVTVPLHAKRDEKAETKFLLEQAIQVIETERLYETTECNTDFGGICRQIKIRVAKPSNSEVEQHGEQIY